MTNAELLAKIRAEIERLIEENNNIRCDSNKAYCQGYGDAFVDLLPFLDTLESEKPIIPDGLDEEVHRFFEECIEVHEVPLYGKVKEGVITVDCYEITARHFAKWGAEHAKDNSEKPVPADLEEAAEKHASMHPLCNGKPAKNSFIAGAKWQKEQDEMSKINYEGARAVYDNTVQHLQEKIDEKYELGKKDMKEQMLKEAVEGDIGMILHDKRADLFVRSKSYLPESLGIKCNDKVRIIIVKED